MICKLPNATMLMNRTAKQLNEERAALEKKRKDREEQHLYLPISVVTEDAFKAFQGFDLTNWESDPSAPSTPQTYRVLRASTVGDFTKTVAEALRLPAEQIRLWVMVNRQNKTIRPDQPLSDLDMTISQAYSTHCTRDKPFRLWVETAGSLADSKPPWPNVNPAPGVSPLVLIFLKYFDVEDQTLKGVGHVYMKKSSKVAEVIPAIQQLMGWSPSKESTLLSSTSSPGLSPLSHPATSTPSIQLFEEIKQSMIEPMKPKFTLQQAEIQDGDIICFQRALSEKKSSAIASTGGYTDTREFYDYLLNRIVIRFFPKMANEQEESTFSLALSRKMSYDQYSAKVGEHLKVDPTHLRFSTVLSSTGKAKQPVRRSQGLTLAQTLMPALGSYANSNQRPDALFYEILEMSISELETKRTVRIHWLPEGVVKEVCERAAESLIRADNVKEPVDILAPKNGIVEDLISPLQRKLNLSGEAAGKLRFYESHGYKISKHLSTNSILASISDYSTLFAELMPEDEDRADDNDRAIDAFHFDKEISKPHGVPFKFVVKPVSAPSNPVKGTAQLDRCPGRAFQGYEGAIIATHWHQRKAI